MKTKQRLLVCLILASSIYVLAFFIEMSYITSKIAIILATGPLLYAITLYSIKTKVKIFDDPLGLDIERKPFFGRNFFILSISLFLVVIGLQWGYHMSLWIEANGVLSFESLWFFFIIGSILISIFYQIMKKETRMYWRQIPYEIRIKLSFLQICLVIWAIVYNPESFWLSVLNWGIVIAIGLGISYVRKVYIHSKYNKVSAPKHLHYQDAFAKPERSR